MFRQSRLKHGVVGAGRVLGIAVSSLMFLVSGSAMALSIETGTATLPATVTGQTSFYTVSFNQTYAVAPYVFTVASTEGTDPSAVRIRNVTNTGFEISQVEPGLNDGFHGSMDVSFLVIEEGVHDLGDGLIVEAGSLSTTTTVQNSAAFGSAGGYDPILFSSAFAEAPVLLTQIQTMNSEDNAPPGEVSSPWLTSVADDVTTTGANIALERAQVADGGTVDQNEELAYLAITQGFFTIDDQNGGTVDVAANVGTARGWGNSNASDGVVGFGGDLGTAAPIVVGAQQTRNGGDGGWARLDTTSSTEARFVIDEDDFTDSERNHTTEDVGLVAFSKAFFYSVVEQVPVVPTWLLMLLGLGAARLVMRR